MIKKFVQDNLGCTCPDKVFEQIEEEIVKPGNTPFERNITVGGRLLIYIRGADNEDLEKMLQSMLEAGKKERDERSLNRFRAVLAVAAPEKISPLANHYFSRFEGKDERMHLHIVQLGDLENYFPVFS